MATLREFILSQSVLPAGNTIKDHIDNPGSSDCTEIIGAVFEVEVTETQFDIELGESLTIELEETSFDV